MKIGLVSSTVPHVNGGYRFIVDWLEPHLKAAGHQVERIYLPNGRGGAGALADMTNYRMMQLTDSCDRIVTFRPPAHALKHPHKIVWFIHHERMFYDLWDSPYNVLPQTEYWSAYRARLMEADRTVLGEAKRLFSNSAVIAARVKLFNNLDAEILYPPISEPDRFRSEWYSDELLFVCRVEHHKRQHLAVEAMALTKSQVRLRIGGVCSDPAYALSLRTFIAQHNLQDRVILDLGWLDEADKVAMLARALGVVYIPLDEDSYGYPILEAAHSKRPIITVSDSGGVLEFVQDGKNGFVTTPDPKALAETFDRLYLDKTMAARLGAKAFSRVAELGIGWNRVVERLTA
jgi:glycosyltransferase involved in cell wall biosynthesis